MGKRSRNRQSTGWWTKERQQRAYSVLREKAGLTDAGARGLVSRWANVESRQGPKSKNPKSGAFGIHQGLGSRKPSSSDFEDQLDHVVAELNGSEKRAGDLLRNAKTLEEGAIGASAFERAEGYNKRTKRDNFVNATLRGMPHIATSVASAAPAPERSLGGLLSSFFGPAAAQADEMPGGIMAPSKEQDYFGSVPTTGGWEKQNQEALQDRAARAARVASSFPARPEQIAPNAPQSSEAYTQQMERETPGNYQPGFADPKADRLARVAPDEASAQLMEREVPGMYQPGAAAAKGDRLGSNLAAKGNRVGTGAFAEAPGILGAPKQDEGMLGGLMSAATSAGNSIGGLLGNIGGAYGIFGPNAADANIDPSTYAAPQQSSPAPTGPTPGGLRDAARRQQEQKATIERAARERAAGVPMADAVFHDIEPGAEHPIQKPDEFGSIGIGGLQPIGAETAITGMPSALDLGATLGGGLARGMMSLKPSAAPPMGPPTTIDDAPTIASPEDDTAPEDQPTIGNFPAAPPEDTSFAGQNPKTAKALKEIAIGGLLGGLPGAAMGGLRGLLGGRMPPGFDAGMPQSDRFSVGSGLSGINAALGGPRGATAKSLSNPGMSVTSLGNGQSLRRSDKYGWTEVVGPDGSVVGIRYDDPDSKGILGRISKGVGGLMSGHGYGISPGAQGAIDAGRGGLY